MIGSFWSVGRNYAGTAIYDQVLGLPQGFCLVEDRNRISRLLARPRSGILRRFRCLPVTAAAGLVEPLRLCFRQALDPGTTLSLAQIRSNLDRTGGSSGPNRASRSRWRLIAAAMAGLVTASMFACSMVQYSG